MHNRLAALATPPAVLAWYKASYSGLPQAAWGVAGVVLVHNAGRMVSTFLAVYLLTELRLSDHLIGLIVTAYGSGAVLGSLLGGWTSARFSPRGTVLTSLCLVGAGYFCLAIVRDPVTFAALTFSSAIFEGALRPPLMLLLLTGAHESDRTRCYALYQVALNLGYALGAVAGGTLAEIYFPLIFWVDGGTSILAAVALVHVVPLAAAPAIAGASVAPRAALRRAGNGPIVVLCCVGFLTYCVAHQRLSIYPLYLTTAYGLSPSEFGGLLMFNGLLIAGIGMQVTNWLKHVDQRWTAAIGSLLLCGSFAALPAGSSLAFAFVSCVVLTLGEILFLPSIVSLVYGWSRAESAGQSMGAFFAVSSACRALGPVLGVWAFALVGPTATWLSCGAMGIAASVLLLSLPRQPCRNGA